MAEEWILDVLTDLRTFAERNGLEATEQQLKESIAVVANELASNEGDARRYARSGICNAGRNYREIEGDPNSR